MSASTSTASGPTPLQRARANAKARWDALSLTERFTCIGGAVLLGIIFIIALISISLTKTEVKNPDGTVQVVSPNVGANNIVSKEATDRMNLLNDAFKQLKTQHEETRALVNDHTARIKAAATAIEELKGATASDPKQLKELQDGNEELRKMLATPPVKLLPMTGS